MRYFFNAVLRCSLLLACTGLFASELDRIQPKQPRVFVNDPSSVKLRSTMEQKIPANEQILGLLNGVVLLSNVSGIKTQSIDQAGVHVLMGEQAYLPGLEEVVSPYLNQGFSLQTLNLISKDLLSFYQSHDYPFVDVYTPAGQDVTSGVVQMVVLLASAGGFEVEGQQHFSSELLNSYFDVKLGDQIKGKDLHKGLYQHNSNPFRQSGISAQRGERLGEAKLKVEVKDSKPWRVYSGAEDTGTESIGERRGFVGFNLGNLQGADHQLSYQHTFDGESGPFKYRAHALTYQFPVNTQGHTLQTSVSYSEVESSISNIIDSDAENKSLAWRYIMPVQFNPEFFQQWEFGYQYKNSNNNLAFGGIDVLSGQYAVSQFNVAYQLAMAKTVANQLIRAELFLSPGDMFAYNDTESFEASQADADAQYGYMKLSYRLDFALPKDFKWNLDIRGHYADELLLSSERIGIGGYASVRGYDEYTALGERGALMRNELSWKAYSIIKSQSDQFRPLVFVDVASVSRAREVSPSADLQSYGLGFRYRLSSYLSARADYGFQLKALDGQEKDERVHFNLTASY